MLLVKVLKYNVFFTNTVFYYLNHILIDTIYVVIMFSIKDKSHESIRTYVEATLVK